MILGVYYYSLAGWGCFLGNRNRMLMTKPPGHLAKNPTRGAIATPRCPNISSYIGFSLYASPWCSFFPQRILLQAPCLQTIPPNTNNGLWALFFLLKTRIKPDKSPKISTPFRPYKIWSFCYFFIFHILSPLFLRVRLGHGRRKNC